MTRILTHFHKQDRRKLIILLLAVYTLVFAFLMPDRHLLVEQYLALLLHQTYLIQDAFVTAGFAATFFNVALHFFVAYYLMSRNERSKISGLQIAAIGIFIGHSFFGTHILNIVPILVGTVLYAHWTHQSFKLFTTVSLFATATAPLVSFVALEPGLSIGSVLAACLVGILLGFIAPPLAEHYLKFHNGLSLYNYGFTTGYMAMFFVLALPYLGWETQLTINLLQTNSHILLTYFSIIWAGFALLVVKNFREAIQHYPKLLKSSGRLPDDFVAKYGIYSTLLNMCCNSGLYLLIILLLGEPLNGPVLGALLSFFGFSAFGKHTKNCLPVTLGIMAACLLLGQPLTGIRFQLAFFLGNGLAPISGFYGMTYGFIAGFLHYNLTSLAFGLHQGMSLYNNGFTTGLVAGFLFPIIENIQDHKPKWTQLHWRKNVKRKK
ncbi:DUF1576 domain-containing protein [Streptococcus oriscaviae]|uniref:DUF1576 domain-containing protein n=1 Tax=Streptococcus oriscaviae TaxID=2781599 RepID=A0ABX7YNH4_9STRE|nr:DUF1576 domain-containing protein [Streptococcus oriscaviae]QUE55008.1 DUF1576 domain-containing protein [Streptococcus oriscaviae]